MAFARLTGWLPLAAALALGLAQPAAAQFNPRNDVTSADVQRLQDGVYEAARDIGQVRSRDPALASELQSELDDARDEAIYLKVKLRKHEPILRRDYDEVRDRIDTIRSRARGDRVGGYTPPRSGAPVDINPDRPSRPAPAAGRSQNRNEIPVGTEFDVRLQTSLNSRTAQVEDRFEATTMVDLLDGDRVLVPAGSVMRGIVSSVERAGRIERKGSLTVTFDQIVVHGRTYPMRGTVTDALESEGIRGETGRIGAGAGVGAIIGGILGGVKGAIAGILIGGGGVIAATEGQDVELPVGSVLRVRLDSPLTLR
jgi:hypothetical protein